MMLVFQLDGLFLSLSLTSGGESIFTNDDSQLLLLLQVSKITRLQQANKQLTPTLITT